MSISAVEESHDDLYANVKKFFVESTSGSLSVLTVTLLTRYSMELMQTNAKWSIMKGSEKKALVVGVLNALIKDLLNDPSVVGPNVDESFKAGILATLDLAPMIIDAAVDFAKTYHSTAVGGSEPLGNGKSCCFPFC